MKLPTKKKIDLDKKFQKVLKTPASFAFFVAIHDFIEYIELNPALMGHLESNIAAKYANLKRVYQGLEDAAGQSHGDLGHERYMAILDLNRIEKKDVSESNSFWKKRELFRKLIVEIYERLNPHFSQS